MTGQKKALTAALLAFLALTGCQMNSAPSPVTPGDISYFKDSRTGLCFAATNSQHEGFKITSIANVPCTSEVERLAK
jgi:hypothetical protein